MWCIHEEHSFKIASFVSNDSMIRRANSLLKHASFKSMKSMHIQTFQFFFIIDTILANLSRCCSSRINPQTKFLTSTSCASYIFGLNFIIVVLLILHKFNVEMMLGEF